MKSYAKNSFFKVVRVSDINNKTVYREKQEKGKDSKAVLAQAA
jgi:hypothetical protein